MRCQFYLQLNESIVETIQCLIALEVCRDTCEPGSDAWQAIDRDIADTCRELAQAIIQGYKRLTQQTQ